MSPNLVAEVSQKSLDTFISWGCGQTYPVSVALALLCVVISIQQVPPGTHENSGGEPLPFQSIMDICLSNIESLIISNDEYAGSIEGIDIMILQAKSYVNLGRPQKAWILLHRAISTAQLIGLHKEGTFRTKDIEISNEDRQRGWSHLNTLDRYLSIILGLPRAVSDGEFGVHTPWRDTTDLDIGTYQQKLSLMAGYIVERNKFFTNDSLLLTMNMDFELGVLERNLPLELQNPESTFCIDNDSQACFRLMARFWHCQLQIFLHLPFLLQSRANRELDPNHLACFSASRKMLRLYHVMRLTPKAEFYICRMIDFQGFTASLLLLLGLLGYHEMCSSSESGREKDQDLDLVDVTIGILERASCEYGGVVASQGAEVLKRLREIMARTGSDETQKSTWTERISVPYFGLITISTTDRSDSDGTVVLAESGGLSAELWPENQVDGHGYDIDWQTMVNIDLDQDWTWNPDLDVAT
jgi:hypothetical protein